MIMIDFRSDTVTKPSIQMRKLMAEAAVGDDVYGEDPTVLELEEKGAALTGQEEALFVSSGTQSNLIALFSHLRRGDEYIAGQTAHTYKYEAGGGAVLASVQPQPLEFEKDGTLDLNKVEKKIKVDDVHFARTRLLCLENTNMGRVLPLEYLDKALDFAAAKSLATHLDGARVFNAAVKLKLDISRITSGFNSVSICLSKGLGAPVGSLLCGNSSFIAKARKWRKILGGGMRQVGIIAAAGIYALEHNIERLEEDHEKAIMLARGLSTIDEIQVDGNLVQTNMVFVKIKPQQLSPLVSQAKDNGIILREDENMRMVTHLEQKIGDIEKTIQFFKKFYQTI
ncbi:MAG: low-specificity L-threonine aldolase [Deltaproteobacteria bacterium]|nr:low-specificity L-threonine aldolase [Deltaproteobacteria bacterium]